MPAPYSTGYQAQLQAVNDSDVEIILLEITHADLVAPIRVCNDTEDLVSGGNTYIAAAFQFVLPDDRDGQTTRAQLSFSNIGRDLMQWLEAANGGAGALVRVRLVRKSLPNNIEADFTVGLQNVSADVSVVTADLGYDQVMDRAAIGWRYDALVAPGLF